MKRVLKKYVIPHPGNDHRPHLLRERGALALAGIALFIFFVSVAWTTRIPTGGMAAIYADELVRLTNADRAGNGAVALTPNPLLVRAAELKAKDMAAKGYFAHTGPDGSGPQHWLSEAGYRFVYAGENLAVHFTESSDVERAWMDSPGHRANILNGVFREIGIATAVGTLDGREAVFVAEFFGTPPAAVVARKPAAPAPAAIAPSPTPVRVASNPPPAPARQPVVKDAFVQEAAPAPSPVASTPAPAVNNAPVETTPFVRASLRAGSTMYYSYAFLIAVIALVLALMLSSEFKKVHLKNLAFGLALIALMVGLSYVYSAYVVAHPLLA